MNKKIEEIKHFFAYYCSFEGIYKRIPFWGALIFGSLVFYVFSQIPVPYFDVVGWLGYFYIALSAYQKRCRDLHIKGSWMIAVVSVFFIYMAITHPLGIDKSEFFLPISQIILFVYLCVYLYAQFMPGKKEADEHLTSPLLKHPKAYFAFCLLLFLLGRVMIENWLAD